MLSKFQCVELIHPLDDAVKERVELYDALILVLVRPFVIEEDKGELFCVLGAHGELVIGD